MIGKSIMGGRRQLKVGHVGTFGISQTMQVSHSISGGVGKPVIGFSGLRLQSFSDNPIGFTASVRLHSKDLRAHIRSIA